MQNNSKIENIRQKSIFSCNVYQTNNQGRSQRNLIKPNQPILMRKDPQILYVNQKLFQKQPPKEEIVKECSTQTSKTLLQLVQNKPGLFYDVANQTSTILQPKKSEETTKVKAASFFETLKIDVKPDVTNEDKIIKVKTPNRSRSNSPVRIGLEIKILNEDKIKEKPENISPDSLAESTPNLCEESLQNCYSLGNQLSEFTLEGSCHEQDCVFTKKNLTQTFLEKNPNRVCNNFHFKSKSSVEYQHPNYIQETPKLPKSRLKFSCKSLDLPDNSFYRNKTPLGFMCPTRASQIKSVMPEIQSTNSLIPRMRRGKSTSPKISGDTRRFECSRKIPYIDQSKSDVGSSTTLVNTTRNPEFLREKLLSPKRQDTTDEVLSLITTIDTSNSSFNESVINTALNKLQELDWRTALKGLADIVEICRVVDDDLIYEYMGIINQRLIQLLKSPRSHVCRIACQAAGHLFEYVKDTRRPTFDEIVDILLHKTADANKFIRQDANMALDCMVTHVTIFNAVRVLCTKGPFHKNPLVRSATARLLVCAVVIAGTDFVLNPNNNEYTRKRIILTMAILLEDKNLETRKLAERLYKVLSKDSRFDVYLKKYLEREQLTKFKRTLKFIHKK